MCLYKIYLLIILKISRYFVKYCIDIISKLKSWYRVITTSLNRERDAM